MHINSRGYALTRQQAAGAPVRYVGHLQLPNGAVCYTQHPGGWSRPNACPTKGMQNLAHSCTMPVFLLTHSSSFVLMSR